VDALNSLMCGGQLSAAAKTQIVNYVSTMSSTTTANLRDRARAVIQLVTYSPDYTVQR